MNNDLALAVEAALSGSTVTARITDRRPDTVSAFESLSEAQRTALAGDAWAVGLRALMNAYRQAEEARLADVGSALVGELDQHLRSYAEKQQASFVGALAQYFDPKDGKVATRIDAFVRDGGELARTMEKFLAPEHGALAKTLARELGENSPLLRRLSPTDSEGVVAILESKLRDVLTENHEAFARALDPLAEDGAIARFLRALRQDLEKADTDRTKQLTLATKALDANDETSLLSRLIRETQSARTSMLRAMNPDEPGSPLATLRGSLTTMFEKHAKGQAEAMTAFEERQRKLEQDIREAVTRLEERKRGEATSARGGATFEDAVLGFVQRAVQGAPIVVDATGNSVGARPGCKVGDQVLRFAAESIYAGASLVVEAKRDASYTVTKALKEIEEARSNRGASAGLFVMAKSHAPTGFPVFARYGVDILVTWDDTDEGSDPYLHAGVLLGLALTTRHRRPEDAGNISALTDIEARIQAELTRHDKMRKMADNIRKNAEDLGDELRKGSDKMNTLLKNAKETLKALNVELSEVAEETKHPIQLPPGSLEAARGDRDAA
jgi:hypothetical protein